MLTCVLRCVPPCRPVLRLLGGLAALLLFLAAAALSPLWLLFYALCWTRAKVTQLFYRAQDMEFLDGGDAFYGQDIASTDCLINVACLVEGSVNVQAVKELMLNRVVSLKDDRGQLLFPKFSRYVALKGGYLLWCAEEKFSIDHHVFEYRGKLPNTEAGLLKIVTKTCNRTLPPRRSGWQIVLIPSEVPFDIPVSETYFVRFPQSCVLCRVHHSIADGLSLARLIVEQLTDGEGTSNETKSEPNKSPRCRLGSKVVALAKFVYAFVFAPFVLLRQVLGKDKNPVHGPKLANEKLVGWTPAISLRTVKDIKQKTGTTVNDVLMACLSGALRRYFLARKSEVPAFLHGAVPVSLQNPRDPLRAKNSLTFVLAGLPTGEADPLRRLMTTKYVMDGLKRAPDALVNEWLLKYLVNVIPDSVTRWIVGSSSVSVIFSNVPGPKRKIKFGGHKVTSIIPLLPHRGTTGLAVCVFSYSRDIRMSVSVDSAIMDKMDDVTEFLTGFLDELKDLQSILKLETK